MEAKLRDVRDWRLWHNATDGAVVHVDARDTRQKWVLTGHAPPMHQDWHRLGALRAEVPSHCSLLIRVSEGFHQRWQAGLNLSHSARSRTVWLLLLALQAGGAAYGGAKSLSVGSVWDGSACA